MQQENPKSLRFVGVIPARYASTRFPGKPLVLIGGKSMIQRVYEQASTVLEDVFVATDDTRIQAAVLAFGGQVIMTSELHKSGTDRCCEALNKIDKNYDVLINIQGDEPFIQARQIQALQSCFVDSTTQIATLAKAITVEDGPEMLHNPNIPKIVINKNSEAMYFSRSIIPYIRGAEQQQWVEEHRFFKHIGIYAYQVNVLNEITKLPLSSLERAESLEQLRWLENGYRIKVAYTDVESVGIDTPDDLKKLPVFD